MYIDFSVTNQTLSRTSNDKTVENSQNYWRCRFNFVSADWGEVTKAAMFKTPDMEKPVIRLLVDNECDFPNGTSRSTCNIALIGGGSEVITALASGTAAVRSGMIVTTNTVCIPFEDTLDSDEVDCDLSLPDNDFTEFLSKLNAQITKIDNLQEQIKVDIDGKADKKNEDGGFTGGHDAVSGSGGAVGKEAQAGNGFAGGCGAITAIYNSGTFTRIDAVQLGSGLNKKEFTMNVYDYELIANDATTKSCSDGGKYLKDVGKLSNLTTTDKTNIVSAVNELKSNSGTVTESGGFAAGNGAVLNAEEDNPDVEEWEIAKDEGGAIGANAISYNGGAVGFGTYSISGGAVGYAASANTGGAIGKGSWADGAGGAVGELAVTGNGFAGGKEAKTEDFNGIPIDAIQLGTGQNQNEFSMQVYDYQLLSDDAETKSATDGSKYLKDVGKLSSLATSVKDNIVNAINSIVTLLSQKVDKVNGKGLSANDYTDEEKVKLAGIEANANNYVLPNNVVIDTDYPKYENNTSFAGVVKVTPTYGLTMAHGGFIQISTPTDSEITKRESYKPITAAILNKAIKSALSDANRINDMTDIEKTNARSVIGAIGETELADLKLKSIPHKDVSAYPVTLTDHLADEEFIKCNVYGNADGVGNLDSADGKYKIPITLTGKNLFNFGTMQKNWYIHDNTSSVSINTNDCVVSGKYGDGASNWVLNLNKIPVTTGKKYVVSYNSNFEASRALIRLLDINGNILTTGLSTGIYNSYYNAYLINNTAASNNDRVKVSFSVTNDNVYYILIGMVFMNQKDETMIQTFSKIQFEIGETATEYEDYMENTVSAVLDTALTAGEYIDIVNKKRYNGDTVTDITVNGSLKTTDSANNHISCDTAETPSKIELSYYQDVNKVLSEITNAVLAQGGDV